jgi:hypothetical protein
MERRLASVLGTSAKHVLTALKRAFRAVAITGFVTAIVVGVGTEVIAFFLTGKTFPPAATTHLAAGALAVAFGYAVAITVAVEEVLRAIIKSIELIAEESEKLAGSALREGELLAREGIQSVEALGRGAVSEAGALRREAAGVAGGIGSALSGAVRSAESHLPGHPGGSSSGSQD